LSLYKFKSKAAGDLIMLEPNGRQMLEIIGKTDSASGSKGILLPAEMPAAIAALEAAVAQDEKDKREAQERGEAPTRMESISLRQRAVPFIDMLKRCHQADKEIVWGV
jgi:cyclopropane-fatty-acyl-phospholipid synthase